MKGFFPDIKEKNIKGITGGKNKVTISVEKYRYDKDDLDVINKEERYRLLSRGADSCLVNIKMKAERDAMQIFNQIIDEELGKKWGYRKELTDEEFEEKWNDGYKLKSEKEFMKKEKYNEILTDYCGFEYNSLVKELSNLKKEVYVVLASSKSKVKYSIFKSKVYDFCKQLEEGKSIFKKRCYAFCDSEKRVEITIDKIIEEV